MVAPKEPEEPKTINFDRNHDCFIRAKKIMLYANLYGGEDIVNRLARGAKIYMDLDAGIKPHDYESNN